MKSYIIQIEETNKSDQENLLQIIKLLAKAGIKTKSAGVQQMKTINLKKRSNHGR